MAWQYCHQDWQPEFDVHDTRDGRRELSFDLHTYAVACIWEFEHIIEKEDKLVLSLVKVQRET